MKFFQALIAFVAFFITSTVATAQKPNTNCVDPGIKLQADALKAGYEKQGKSVFQESMLSMTSMEPAPVAVRLQKGISYELLFVGSKDASKLMMEIFDGNDKRIGQKSQKGSDYIVYTLTPSKTDVYLVTLFQKRGVKDMCGYFAIMSPKPKNPTPKVAPVKKAAPSTATKTAPVKNTGAVKAKTTTTKTTTTTTTPNNQRPNPNRTKATQQHQQETQKP